MSIRSYIAAVYGAAAIVVSGFADAEPLRAYDENIGGQLEAQTDDGVVLSDVVHTDVDARITGDMAEVHLRQVFTSLGDGVAQATYLLPLAAGVEVIAIEVAEGTRIERKSIGASSMPVQVWPRMFSQTLNLTGAASVEITLIYRQPVQRRGDLHSIALPISVLPGGQFSNDLLDLSPDGEAFADLPEYLGNGWFEPSYLVPNRVDLRVSIQHDAFSDIYSDTHEIDVTALEGARVIELAASAPVANRTFVLEYRPIHRNTTLVAQAERRQ